MTTKVDREYERIVTVRMEGDGRVVTQTSVIDVGPCAEDGSVWIWDERGVMAGPFDTKERGCAWLMQYNPTPNSNTRTRGFEWTKRVPQTSK